MDTKSIQKSCRQCSTGFTITTEDLAFYEKVSPVFNEKKELIPAPTLCPECRQYRRCVFLNQRNLYRRTCDATGKSIISMYRPDARHPVYERDYWESDAWNPLDYGIDVSFEQSFHQQLETLSFRVPRSSRYAIENENCEYINGASYCRNCYLIFSAGKNENCFYALSINRSHECMDCLVVNDCQNCYNGIDLDNCFHCFSCQSTRDSSFCWYCFMCQGCNNCFGCTNLSHTQYAIFNVVYPKEEYERRISQLLTLDATSLRREVYTHAIKYPRRSGEIYQSENVSGDAVVNGKNLAFCFDCKNVEDSKWCIGLTQDMSSDCYDQSFFGKGSKCVYETIGSWFNLLNVAFCARVNDHCQNIYYCEFCQNIRNCFGCVGLKNKEYCILNKQYTKEEYEALVPKIIEHMRKTDEWGEFFPPSMALFCYNESVGGDWFPLSQQEALKFGFNWSSYEAPFPKVEKTIPAEKLPKDITKIPDDILNWAIMCEVSGKPFRIIKQELEFYRKHNLPIPKRHPDQRHADRMALRNPRKLWERHCDCAECQKNNASTEPLTEGVNALREKDGSLRKIFQTTYAPERPERVYCETCYNREVYG